MIQFSEPLQLLDIPDLAFVAYDRRLAEAAERHGLRVLSPGAV